MTDRGDIILPSGREIYANMGFIGINGDLELGQGSDGCVDGADLQSVVNERFSEPENYQHIPVADKLALADIAIERWKKYRAKVLEEAAEIAKVPEEKEGLDGTHIVEVQDISRAISNRFPDISGHPYHPEWPGFVYQAKVFLNEMGVEKGKDLDQAGRRAFLTFIRDWKAGAA